jgi:ubiquitin-protein ligase
MNKKRLVLEYSAMMERWSMFRPQLCRDASGRMLWWDLDLRAEGNSLPIRIEYPANYPASPPEIIVRVPLPAGTPHLLGGKRMCWRYPGEDKRNRNIWSPGHDTAATCVGVAQRWFYAFLVWMTVGTWTVKDALQ